MGCFSMPKGAVNRRYTPERKRTVIGCFLEHGSNRRIKAKLKGLPSAIRRQQALSAA